MSKEINPFKIVQAQFDHNAELLNLDPALREFMREPERDDTVYYSDRYG